MTLIGILEFEKGIKLEYSDPNWNNWGSKALIGISPIIIYAHLGPSHFAVWGSAENYCVPRGTPVTEWTLGAHSWEV